MKFKDINVKPVAELEQMVNDLKAELFTLRFQNSTGQLDQTHKIKMVRQDIAKVLTALSQKNRGAQ
ncbi:50S RIBOSOMAL PROTEIN L29 [Mycoplasmopsis pulmonis]|uniref:Large ribosomal subunit protein uL29 n=1 Tax=Mycoplasmopsis pulmonis (strain UAB CTIP) TaxID=272635 RepID=RL29_MYCPU|nr:50S ribosomal protein L29 [Mycoplasmopsis pulmonis]Q98PZ0.1 RecName: Full=Large ribosomal subunit protein uL29; AltName: Full=50S ribosomal protein L29 [Mycoplasmopsis pulmonis UAB CTIP]MDZ7293617.1 50S ribosomal protein L29 [Mycoplasmopsis pulmonis]CAC13752.1 50S RIBOSOMAL PROTEIN L29 [Mycoplasmopsis pulmonis]VEU68343.1 50S ribosomal protein L29 [Mycoplasmopsis pulmonis]